MKASVSCCAHFAADDSFAGMQDALPGIASSSPGSSHTTAVAHHIGSLYNPDRMQASASAIVAACHSDMFYGNNIADRPHWLSG